MKSLRRLQLWEAYIISAGRCLLRCTSPSQSCWMLCVTLILTGVIHVQIGVQRAVTGDQEGHM